MSRPNYFIDDMYEYYSENGGEFDKDTYKTICSIYNQHVIDHLLRGMRYRFGARLAGIEIIRMDRNYNKPVVNWNESLQLRDELLAEGKKLYDKETGEGHEWLVYYTDDDYCRVHWEQSAAMVPNKKAYQFDPSRGTRGLKTRMKEYLNKDPRNKYTFKKI